MVHGARSVKLMVRRCGGSDAGGHAERSGGCPPSVRAAAAQRPRGSTRARGRAEALPPPALYLYVRTNITTSKSVDIHSAVAGPPPSQGHGRRCSGESCPKPSPDGAASVAKVRVASCHRRDDEGRAAQLLSGLGWGWSGAAGRGPAPGGPPAWGGGAGRWERCCAAAPHPITGGPNAIKPPAPCWQPVMEIVLCGLLLRRGCP